MEKETGFPLALVAAEVPPRTQKSLYPAPFAASMEKRTKRQLGNAFGLQNFGVNLTVIEPGGASALRHAHKTQDEFVYVLSGRPVLVTDEGRTELAPGMCAGFRAGTGNGHQLVNPTDEPVTYLEVGDRSPGDMVTYPDDDLQAVWVDGAWRFLRKDGTS